jgi:hypothetical protein
MENNEPILSQQPIKNKKIFFVILVLILLVLASGGAYAYYSGVFVTLPSLTSEAIDGAKVATSATYDTTISIDFSEIKSMTSSVSSLLSPSLSANKIIVTTKGSYDVSDKNNPKSSSVISVDLGALSLEAEIRALDKTLYAEITKVPDAFSVGISMFVPNFSSYVNKWFSFPLTSQSGQGMNNPLASLSPIDTSLTDKITGEQKDYLYKMFRDAHFIKAVKKLSPEIITGELSYHFTFDLDRAGISSYLQSLQDYVKTIGKDNSSLSAFDTTSFDKSLDQVKNFTGEIWIGRSDKLLHKVVVNFAVQPDVTKNENVKISIVGIMSGWNQPVSIVAPDESIPFADLMSSAFNQKTQENGKEATIKADLSNLRAQAELFYDSNNFNTYSGFCTSKELKTARKNIEDNGGTGFVCKDGTTKYAIGVKLPSTPGYWCVDSTGVSNATTTLPISTVCPVK